MRNAPMDGAHSGPAVIKSIAELEMNLSSLPPTRRTKQACDYLRIARTQVGLVMTMFAVGFDDRLAPASQKPKMVDLLLGGLESGALNTPDADELLSTVKSAKAGNRVDQERIMIYLQTPGVLEALEALDD